MKALFLALVFAVSADATVLEIKSYPKTGASCQATAAQLAKEVAARGHFLLCLRVL